MQKNHTVWIWKDGEQVPRYVGYGRFIDKHPALTKWEGRGKDDSDAGKWLQRLDDEPERENYGPRIVSFETAIAAVLGLRARFRETLFKTRGPSTYHGGHPARGVFYFCAEDIEKSLTFESVREAARETGRNASTITRWCKDDKNVAWGYIEAEDTADAS